MFSNSNSAILSSALVKKDKKLQRQRREFLSDTFVSYSLSTSRLPHTYLPTLSLYKYFARRSVEGTLGIPKPLAVQVLSFLYCIAANEMSALTAYDIIGILLNTFNAAYKNYIEPVPLESMEDDQVRTAAFIMFTLTVRFEISFVFNKNYPGSFNRLEYFIQSLMREYDKSPFAAPDTLMNKLDSNDSNTIDASLRLLKSYKDAKSPEYGTLKRFMSTTFGYTKKKPEPAMVEEIDIEMESETLSEPTSVETRKRSNSADSFFSSPQVVFNAKQSLTSTPSSLDLKQEEESNSSLYVAQRNTKKRLKL